MCISIKKVHWALKKSLWNANFIDFEPDNFDKLRSQQSRSHSFVPRYDYAIAPFPLHHRALSSVTCLMVHFWFGRCWRKFSQDSMSSGTKRRTKQNQIGESQLQQQHTRKFVHNQSTMHSILIPLFFHSRNHSLVYCMHQDFKSLERHTHNVYDFIAQPSRIAHRRFTFVCKEDLFFRSRFQKKKREKNASKLQRDGQPKPTKKTLNEYSTTSQFVEQLCVVFFQ